MKPLKLPFLNKSGAGRLQSDVLVRLHVGEEGRVADLEGIQVRKLEPGLQRVERAALGSSSNLTQERLRYIKNASFHRLLNLRNMCTLLIGWLNERNLTDNAFFNSFSISNRVSKMILQFRISTFCFLLIPRVDLFSLNHIYQSHEMPPKQKRFPISQ